MGRTKLALTVLAILCPTVATWALVDSGVSQAFGADKNPSAKSLGYAGSVSCRECHERFYQLWSTSFHGLAMQPYTGEFAKAKLTPQTKEITIGKQRYRADIRGDKGWVIEKRTSPRQEKRYRIDHVLGGKNVFYFLTPMDKGRLQTLPVAYDVGKKEWFDTASSGIRHFPGRGETDEPVSWKDQQYTFNTACYSCHVSQLSTNYDLKTDTYHTVWAEPGINCETCHGPSEEHNKIARATPKGQPLTDYRLIRTKIMTKEQRIDLCSSCHAKGIPLTPEYRPKERFFDHFDLITLEDPDFYPDGRDLGENYTLTSWTMSPCAKSGKIDCIHCHTSSGRYRFKSEKFNDACMPCHEERVKNAAAHTRHQEGSPGNNCISCHMPMTDFARMRRSDHSMLPPTPAATIAYKSPNACNLCHKDKDAAWADKWVRQWRKRDYQASILHRAGLIEAARKRDWKLLPEMLAYIESKDRNEIYTTSLIRLLRSCEDPKKWPVIIKAMKDPSPLVRGAVAESLTNAPSPQTTGALLEATGDGYRLVRIRAATVLASYPAHLLREEDRAKFAKATEEYFVSILSRPDQWSSHYNLGNYFLQRDDLRLALGAYETAEKLEPRAILPYVNASIVYARMGNKEKAEESLNKALKINPKSAAANFNMGLLKAEQNDLSKAEQYLRAALKEDPTLAVAAYNLCVITARDRISEAVTWCRKASELRPQDPKYAYTLAFYLNQKGDRDEAARTLKAILEKYPGYKDAEMLLREITDKEKRR
jgi:tetratricopeptide (TPR) repeat protein